ncbi:MAG: TIGR02099 family protein [Gammaproteobacteria bacterium]|uniref:YhdP family protein n=1 Tax=Rhodoferax sp. TaxID=50421 RepID=UPI00180C3AA1|nr:YhdP family protein [Rhodoferax sp.]MBU3900298.1 TIGR02099 family protein [Gammaproteobacteria bacterium]MBA3057175.1 TIGR02099 family protein [Rhodoferax sp.]MBU3997916.1 TIGR02099 family protein [Gammaproteobacteria bacterium]MBU4079364.1 TIGR02099 family protein [Gammaproteobacteria bacterium]MBU4111770.1 TIGR02099 family protein [Gammaproteobacteria bacterium]
MIDLTPAPSPLLKTWSTAARWSLGLVLAAWLVFGLTWGALHWLIVPRIGEFRPQLEAYTARVLGVPVRIGTLTAQSTGMIPSFELTDVTLFDVQGRQALRLPRVLAALSPGSLWRLGFEQLYIERPLLNIRRDQNGKITVAGLDFSKVGDTGNSAVDWFFSQLEFVIRDGSILWTDELRATPTLALQQVDLVVRNPGRHHDFQFDATPPALWGERFTVRGKLTQPLLSRHKGQWQDWRGQLYAAFARVDLSELRRYADVGVGVDLRQGKGALRAWVDVQQGLVQGGAADVALSEVNITLGAELQPLELLSVRGRLGARLPTNGFHLSTQALAFDTRDGLVWPGGNVSIDYSGAEEQSAARGEIKADMLDLQALSQIADRLPIDAVTRAALLTYAPKGLVQRLQASWQGPMGAFSQYQVKGLVNQLELAASAHRESPIQGVPPTSSAGVRGARIDFDFNQFSGKANISLNNGALVLPGVFDEPVIPVAQLSTDVKWQVKGEHIAVQLPNLKFNNADAEGEAQVKWETGDPAKSGSHSRFPGVIDLQATLSRADGTRVHRYLPSLIGQPVRDYVRDAVTAGTASGVKAKVRGDLSNMPFRDPKQGDFRISADVQNATLVYVPRSIQDPQALPWPPLTQLSGELVFDRAQLQVKGARARMGAASNLQANKVEALIADLNDATVTVTADLQGALAEGLGIVKGSPLGSMIGNALDRAVASGNAQYKLKLSLPIGTMEKSTVLGSVTLANNELQITPDTPKLSRARGVVEFTDSGFSIVGGQARLLGGDTRLEGGSLPLKGANANLNANSVLIRASGTVSAEGLRLAQELGFAARMAQHAAGSAAYTAVLGFRRGVPELTVSSNLQGLSLSLPAPLNKTAQALMPFRLQTALLAQSLHAPLGDTAHLQDQLILNLGQVASIHYVRDLSGAEPRVTRGSLGVGLSPQESAPLPEEGVVANINLSGVNLDAWGDVLEQAAGSALTSAATATPGAAQSVALSYLPTSMAVRAQTLTLGGRTLHHVVLGASREGLLWRANLDATELNGYLEYRQPSGPGEGRLYARLARLTIAPSTARDMESLLAEQPASIPALDIVVDDFELRGKRLGRVEMEAVNRGAGATTPDGPAREWRLNKFNIVTPDAVLTATGNWAAMSALPPTSTNARRRTVMNFKLLVADGGNLLARFGMPGVVRKARGQMEGQVAWMGSPISLDYPTMTGAFTVNMASGQFLKADPGLAKLLGVLSLQALPRRLTLDFRDVFSEGFSFDFVRGDVTIEKGIAKTNNLQMKGVNAAVLMEGQADIEKETQDLKVVVVPEINAGTASLIASVINPAIGIGTFLAQLFFRQPLTEAATQEFHIDGSWADPQITRVKRKTGRTNGTPQ